MFSYSQLGMDVRSADDRCWILTNREGVDEEGFVIYRGVRAAILVARGIYIPSMLTEYIRGQRFLYLTCGNPLCISTFHVQLPLKVTTQVNQMDEMDIESIRRDLSKMTDEELQEVIRGKRTLRRQPDTTPSKVRKPSSIAPKKSRAKEISNQLSALTPEQKAEILKALGG